MDSSSPADPQGSLDYRHFASRGVATGMGLCRFDTNAEPSDRRPWVRRFPYALPGVSNESPQPSEVMLGPGNSNLSLD